MKKLMLLSLSIMMLFSCAKQDDTSFNVAKEADIQPLECVPEEYTEIECADGTESGYGVFSDETVLSDYLFDNEEGLCVELDGALFYEGFIAGDCIQCVTTRKSTCDDDSDNDDGSDTDDGTPPDTDDGTPPDTDDGTPPDTDDGTPPDTDDGTPPDTDDGTPPDTDDGTPPDTDDGTPPDTDDGTPPDTDDGTPPDYDDGSDNDDSDNDDSDNDDSDNDDSDNDDSDNDDSDNDDSDDKANKCIEYIQCNNEINSEYNTFDNVDALLDQAFNLEEGLCIDLDGSNIYEGYVAGECIQCITTSKKKNGKKCGNNGHGNNEDGVDVSNPGKGKGGPNGRPDPSGDYDDEKRP